MGMPTPYADLVVEEPGSDFRVHRSVFLENQVLEDEQRSIFTTSWIYVGHATEVAEPGDYLTRSVVGEKLILCRDEAGEIRVFFNSCRHRGALVCAERAGNAKQFRCFYHAWTYRNSGELIGVTEKMSFPPSFDQKENGLVAPRTAIYRDFIFVTFSQETMSLEDYLEPVRPYLDAVVDQSLTGDMEVIAGSHLYRMGGNWKLIVENSIDGYHGRPVHATYFQYLGERGYDLSGGLDGVGLALGHGHAVLRYIAPFGRSVAKHVGVMGDEAIPKLDAIEDALVEKLGDEKAALVTKTSKNILIYPNLIIIDAASLQIRTLDPIATDSTDVSAWCLGPIGEDAALREHRLQGYLEFLGPGGFATPDDNEAIESCQEAYGRLRGAEWSIVSKGIAKQEPHMMDEEQMRGFWRQWREDMSADQATRVGMGR
jgi:p-cumate 2,3-dioxygenase alpha subunit